MDLKTETGTPSRSERRYLTLNDKMNVIEKREKGICERNLAIEYKCSKTQINNIYKNRESIRKDWAENKYFGLNVKRKGTYEDINVEVYRWYCKMKNKDIRVTGPMLKKKALEMAENCGIEKFRASNGWLYGFRNNYKIVFQGQTGAEVTEIKEEEEMNEFECSNEYINGWIEVIGSVLKQYDLRNIFSLDVTSLLFKILPSKTLSITSKLCKNYQMPNECLTVLICSNCEGEKLPPVIVGNAKRPECLNGTFSGLHWFHNSKAVMNSAIFNEWLQDLDFKLGIENRKIILFMDHFPCSISSDHLENIQIKFLPANADNCLQPFDQGITKYFKLNYRKNQLEYLIARENGETTALESCKKILLLDAVRWIKRAWEEVKPTTIEKCFNLCGFKLYDIDIDEEIYETDLARLAEEAGTDFDEVIFEEEMKLTCFDLVKEEPESKKLKEDVVSQNTESEIAKIKEALISADKIQRILNQLKGIDNKGQMLSRVMDLKNDIEKEIVRKKMEDRNEETVIEVFDDYSLVNGF